MSQWRSPNEFIEAGKKIFKRNLKSAIDLGVYEEVLGSLNPVVWDAIRRIVREYPNISNEAVKNAKLEYEDWLKHCQTIWADRLKSK